MLGNELQLWKPVSADGDGCGSALSLFCLWCPFVAQEKNFFSAFEGGACVLCFYLLEMEKNVPACFSVCMDTAV